MKFKSDIEVQAGLRDGGNDIGTAGQILSSTGSQTNWIDQAAIVAAGATRVLIACKNTSGGTITKGTPVYQTGNVGATDVIEIAEADALISTGYLPAIGLLETDLINNAFGHVVITGELLNITTDSIDGLTPTTGDTIYLKSGGGLTLTKPTGEGNAIQNLGLVGKVSGGNAGSLTVASIMRQNDVPNLPTGKIWVGDGNTTVSDVVYLDETNGRMGIGTTSPTQKLNVVNNNTATWTARFTNNTNNVYLSVNDANNYGIYVSGETKNYFSGNVGIGTTSPVSVLEVYGGSSGVNEVDRYVRFKASNGEKRFDFYMGGTGNASRLSMFDSDGTTEGVRLSPAGNSYFNGGNVGIGTTSPVVRLDFGSATGKAFHLYTSGVDYYGFNMLQYDSGPFSTNIFAGNGGDIKLRTASGTSTQSTRLTVKAAGNVGIGTTSPGTKLHVGTGSGATVDTGYQVVIDSAGIAGLQILSATNQSGRIVFGDSGDNDIGMIKYDHTDNSMGFRTNGSGNERMRINSSGEVLVGVTSNQTESKLTSRQNGSSIEFGHLNQSSGYYGTLGAMYSSGRPFLSFSCDSSPTSAGNNFATRGFKGNVIFSETNGNLKFAQATNANSTSQALTDRMAIKNDGAVQFNAYDSTNNTGTPTYLLGTDASGNIVKTNTIPGSAAGPYLPLAGGTMTGDLKLNDNVVAKFGTGDDLRIQHASGGGGVGYIQNYTGDLQIQNRAPDKDILFRADDGSGVVTSYLVLDGSTTHAYFSNPGNVGIGTTSPGYKLDVDGDVRGDSFWFRGNTASSPASVAGFYRPSLGHVAYGFNTNELFRITSTGNVGIGTASPSFPLDVDTTSSRVRFKALTGSSTLELSAIEGRDWIIQSKDNGKFLIYDEDATASRLFIDTDGSIGLPAYGSGTNTGTLAYKLGVDSSGNIIETAVGAGAVDGSGTANYITKWTDADTIGDSIIYDNGTNVGIGTTSPGYKLTVNGDVDVNNGAILAAQAYGINLGVSGYDIVMPTTTRIAIKTSGSERVSILNTGNVGIGTTSPSQKLHVSSGKVLVDVTSSVGTELVLQNLAVDQFAADKNYHEINFITSSTSSETTGGYVRIKAGQEVSGNDNRSYLGFWTAPDDGTVTEKMRIDSSGNVGIGTTSPTAKLHVVAPNGTNVGSGNFNFILDAQDVNSVDSNGLLVKGGANNSAGTTFAIQDYSGNTDFMVNGAGNVGIGTTSPGTKLHISVPGGSSQLTLERTGGGAGKVVLAGAAEGLIVYDDLYGPKMYVGTSGTYNGNVGIGTTSPDSKLNILSTGIDDEALVIQDNARKIKIGRDSIKVTDLSNAVANMYLQGDGSNVILPNAASRLGIGTTNPGQKLDVIGGVGAWAANNTSTLQLFNGRLVGAGRQIANLVSYNGNGALDLYDGANTLKIHIQGSGNSYFNAGNVGIGTTSPSQKLDVDGNVSLGKYSGSDFDKRIGLNDAAGAYGAGSSYIEFEELSGTGTANFNKGGNIRFYNHLFAGGTSETLTLLANGNVGIGTTSPGYKLHVEGSVALDVMPGHESEGSVRIGRYDFNTSRYNDIKSYVSSTESSNYLKFSVHGGVENATVDVMTLKGNGNVGIGTTSPNAKIDLVGGDVTGGLKISADKVTSAFFAFGADANETRITSTSYGGYKPLTIHTGGSESMRIDSSGNVGIGTTSPGSKLSIGGTTGSYSSGIGFEPTGTGARVYRTFIATDGGFRFDDVTAGFLTRLAITSSGNVGIGTTSPDAKLQVAGGGLIVGTTSHTKSNNAFSNGNISLDNGSTTDSPGIHFYYGNNTNFGIDAHTTGFRFVYNLDEAGGNVLLNITSSGNVGIGTTSPTDKLTVNGNLSIFGNKIYNGSASNSAGVSFPSSTTRIDGYNGITFHSSTTTVGSQSERMRITNSGNVGIGTTNPATVLDVRGAGSVSLPATTGTTVSTGTRFRLGQNTSQTRILDFGVSSSTEGAWLQATDRTDLSITMPFLINPNGGNVGIGTTSPGVKLVVADGPKATSGTLSQNSTLDIYGVAATSRTDNATVDMLRLHRAVTNDNKGSTFAIGLSYYEDPGSNLPRTRVDFKTTEKAVDDSDATKTVMSLVDSGNVGIGTTSPGAKLDVTGSGDVIKAVSGSQNITTNFVAPSGGSGLNNIISTGGKFNIGTSDAQPFSIGTGSISRVYILSGGNVGIGTTSPNEKLHVAGNIHAYAPSGIDAGLFASTAAGSTTIAVRSSGVTHFNGGNVGIGTTSPDTLLNLASSERGSNAPTVRITNTFTADDWSGDTSDLGRFEFFTEDTSGNGPYILGKISIKNDQTVGTPTLPSGAMVFGTTTYNAPGGSTERMRITSSGRVGIGTSLPATTLQVNGLISADQGAGNGYTFVGDLDTSIERPAQNTIILKTAGSERLRVNSSGNVGINVTNPNARLNVNGGIKIEGTGSLSFGGSASVPSWAINSSGSDLIIDDQATTSGSVLFNNSEGVALPRLTTTQINAISLPAQGLMAYNTTLNTICFYNGSSWQKVSHTSM